ncbi:MAG TPA: S-layer homology domain-containing protein [Symbiobacteriaceae bacterium]|nr:S-layer homology domain-containing protein [Symbiobacteriaceae bacterium]
MFRRVWAGFLSLLLIAGTLAAAPRPVQAAVSEEEYLAAARQLNKYGLVQGDDRGYRFYSQITRAEMAKLLVYALGLQNEAPRQTGRGVFTDTTGHWADGIVTVAKSVGIMKGYPEGDFRPQAPLTYAEVITALSRLVGLEPSGEEWPRTYLGPATQAGIIPDHMDVYLMLGEPAARGDVFVLLWRTLTEVKNGQGQNLLRRYLDGNAPVLTIDPQPKETTDLTLTVSGTAKDADQVLVNGKATTLTFGYFRADVDLRLGPNTIRIQAVDSAGNLREEVLQVTRKQSPISALSFTGPAQVKVGQSATFAINLKDENGESVSDRKPVTADVQPPSLGTFDTVTGTFTAGTAPGSGTILVKAGAAQSSLPVTVTAGALERIQIEPPVAVADAKEAVAFTVKGFDSYGNEVAPGTVQWTATGGTITSGLFTAPNTAGVYTVTAFAGGKTATATVQPPNFKAASVRLSQPTTTLKANGVSELAVTATVVDAQGNTLTDYKGNLTVTSSASWVANPTMQSVPVTAGVAQILVRAGTTAGTAQIRATTNLTVGGSALVTVTPQRLQAVRLEAASLPNSVSTTYPSGYVEALALDEDGYPMRTALNQTLVVQLRINANGTAGSRAWFVQNDMTQANVALGPLDPATGDVRTRTHVQYTAGIGTFMIDGQSQGAGAFATVYPTALKADQVGLPAAVSIEPVIDTVAGTARDIFVVVLDANGHRVTQGSALAGTAVTLKDQNGVSYTGAVADGPGRYRFSVTQTIAGDYTYYARLQPGTAVAAQTAKVVAGPVAEVRVTATPAVLPADNASQITLRAELVDTYGNRVLAPSHQVTFTPQGPDTGAIQNHRARTVASSSGLAESVFTAGTVVANVTVTVTAALTPALPVPYTITVRGVPDRLALSYGDNSGNGTAGELQDNTGRVGIPLTVFADVLDRFGNVAAYDHGRQITLTAKNLRTGQESTLQPSAVTSGRATFQLSSTTADRYALKAQSTGLTLAATGSFGGGLADAQFGAAQSIRVTVAPDLSVLTEGGGTNHAVITAILVDANGNPTPNQTGRPINITLQAAAETDNAYAYGRFTVDNTSGGAPTRQKGIEIPIGRSDSTSVKFFSGSAGAKNIVWTAQDGTTGNFTIATVSSTTPGSIAVQTEPVDLITWDLPGSIAGQTVTVTVKDANGNRASNANGLVTFRVEDPDARIVAVWDPVGSTWQTTWNAGAYPTSITRNAERGQIKFSVAASSAGVKLYTATYPAGTGTVTAQGYGTFRAVGVDRVVVAAQSARIRRDGTISVSITAQDANGQTVRNVPGTFTVSSPGGTMPSSDTANMINGQATVVLATDRSVWNREAVLTLSWATSFLRASTGLPFTGTISVTVDDVAPTIAEVRLVHGAVDPAANTLNQEDTIIITFSEDVVGLVTGAGTPELEVAGTNLVFTQLGALSRIVLPGGALPGGAGAKYPVAFTWQGRVLRLTLGAPTSGSAPVLTPAAVTAADVTLSQPVTDLAGIPSAVTIPAVPAAVAP